MISSCCGGRGGCLGRLVERVVVVDGGRLRELIGDGRLRVVAVDAELVLGADGEHGGEEGRRGERGRRRRVGAHVDDGRVGEELHDHADVLVVLREHHGRDGERRAARRMRLGEQLGGYLAEVAYLRLEGVACARVLDGVEVDGALVGQVIEDVGGAHGLRSALLVAEYEIDPLVQLARDELGLERHAIDAHEIVRALGPLGQLDVVDGLLLVLGAAQVEAIQVEEHLRQVEELRHQLLHVRRVALAVLPRRRHRVERAVRVVELAVLHVQEDGCERLENIK